MNYCFPGENTLKIILYSKRGDKNGILMLATATTLDTEEKPEKHHNLSVPVLNTNFFMIFLFFLS